MDLHSLNWAGVFSTAFLSIVFLQSGIDKVVNYKQELGWIQQKFVRNALYNYVGLLFLLLTIFEIMSGLLTFFWGYTNVFRRICRACNGWSMDFCTDITDADFWSTDNKRLYGFCQSGVLS